MLVLGPDEDVDACAKAAFDVVARTRNPAAITAATMVNNFVVHTFYITYFPL